MSKSVDFDHLIWTRTNNFYKKYEKILMFTIIILDVSKGNVEGNLETI